MTNAMPLTFPPFCAGYPIRSDLGAHPPSGRPIQAYNEPAAEPIGSSLAKPPHFT